VKMGLLDGNPLIGVPMYSGNVDHKIFCRRA
jgi:hypothetical protein